MNKNLPGRGSDDEPPAPPVIAPELRMRRTELLGMLPIALLPLLALAGVFGPQTEFTRVTAGGIEMRVEYPSRLRYDNWDRLQITLTNIDAPTSDVTVRIDPSYIEAYTNVLFTPAPSEPYALEVDDLAPGESRELTAEVRATEYGSHRGQVTLENAGVRSEAEIETFIFP